MGDVPEPTAPSSQPLVVSSTINKEAEKSNSEEQSSLSENNGQNGDHCSPTPPTLQNVTDEVNTQAQQRRQSLRSSPHTHGYSQNVQSESPHSISSDNHSIHAIPEMTAISTAHPQFRYRSSGFPSSIMTHGYQAQAVTTVPSPVYYPYPNPRYPPGPVYYGSFVPQYGPQTISVTQFPPPQGTYFYTTGYPHSYPPTPPVATTAPNAPPQSQLHPIAHRWPQGQQSLPQYVYMTNTFPPPPGPQPMQPSFSHPVQSVQQHPQHSSSAPGLQYVRRHSHPPRNPPTRTRAADPEILQLRHCGWEQVTRAASGQSGGQSTTNPLANRHDSFAAHTTSSSSVPQMDGASSMQAPENPTSSLLLTTAIAGTHPALPRGPPRKPKQSGHALWVGNLPPGTNVIELKDHFSRGATNDIESVFLISKSNCAFINYKTDTACNEAMTRFHDNRFKGVRLVCRLRRNSAAPTSPSTATGSQDNRAASDESVNQEDQGGKQMGKGEAVDGEVKEDDPRQKRKDRIFILKSLTVEDLDLSVKNGVWATQSHNEEVLNRAFETSDNVYLIFSANKSGEYYGYARMTSRIPEKDVDETDVNTTTTDSSPMAHRTGTGGGLPEALLPKAIFTPATSTAPEGRIIDDSARGTIFWEATEEEGVDGDADKPEDMDELMGATKSWGKPFNVHWLSTTKLPFYRTRGLRNSWNSNREVKIARDGTEVEETVGKRLLQMFHRLAAGNNPAMS